MMEVTDRRREALETANLHDSPTTSVSAPGARVTPTPLRSDAGFHEALDRLPVSADYSVFCAQLRAAPSASGAAAARAPRHVDTAPTQLVSPTLRNARDAAVQQRLDAFRDSFSGPYEVAGTKVIAQPMFRMNTATSFNARNAKVHAAELQQICAKAGIASAAGPVSVGRCTPEQLVKVTQALIDAGKLPPADEQHTTLANRVRGMQWEWGIGVDCAGYTQQAAAAAHGPAGELFKGDMMGDIFSGLMADRRFQTVEVARIRPGDVIHLESPARGAVGHNVICHSHSTLDDAAVAKLVSAPNADGASTSFLSGTGPFHVFEVDSSWGAGKGEMIGGYRRDTWIYDQATFTWATYPAGNRAEALQPYPLTGPQDELFSGAFRPRDAR